MEIKNALSVSNSFLQHSKATIDFSNLSMDFASDSIFERWSAFSTSSELIMICKLSRMLVRVLTSSSVTLAIVLNMTRSTV